MMITRQLLRQWDACYTDEQIAALVPPDGLTPLEVCDRGDVPAVDRLWVLLHEEVIPARELRLLACRWAREACRVAGHTDPRSLLAIETAERYARGEATDEELSAARSAAWAARDAAGAAWAARSADWAARDAAGAAWDAWNAALDAARSAAGADWAARSAARTTQLSDVRAVLAGELAL